MSVWQLWFTTRLHDMEKSGVVLKLVWLDRGYPKASTVADVLSAAGFADFGKQLALLATGTAEYRAY